MATNGRLRDYLTKSEVRALLRAAKGGKRYAARNYAMILLAYRHGFRASELVELRVGDVDVRAGTDPLPAKEELEVERPPDEAGRAPELRAIERVLRGREVRGGEYVFCSERGARLTRNGFWRVVSEAGTRAGLPMNVYTHQLRHATGYYLANKGCDLRLIQEYLGHRQIKNTVRYTALNAKRFEGLW